MRVTRGRFLPPPVAVLRASGTGAPKPALPGSHKPGNRSAVACLATRITKPVALMAVWGSRSGHLTRAEGGHLNKSRRWLLPLPLGGTCSRQTVGREPQA